MYLIFVKLLINITYKMDHENLEIFLKSSTVLNDT